MTGTNTTQLADTYVYRWTRDHEANAIRIETEWKREMAIALEADTRHHRYQSAVNAWLVGSSLVGLFLALCALWRA